jgi:FkbM family methyltransferase
MMSGNIWSYDNYDLRKYTPGSIDYFLDIGGCVGTTAVLFKALVPQAKVFSLEPCVEDFKTMSKVAGFWGVRCYNMALGDGKPMWFDKKHIGAHRFYTGDEKQWWPKEGYFVESSTFCQLFRDFGIHGRYIIKVDTEGGERFLLREPGAIDIIRGSVQFNMEYHNKFGGKREEWRDWFANFKDTHNLFHRTRELVGLRYVYISVDMPVETWRSEYVLVKK